MRRLRPLFVASSLLACDTSDDDRPDGGSPAVPIGPVATPRASAVSQRAAAHEATPGVVVHVVSGGNVSAMDAAAIAALMRSGLRRCAPAEHAGKLVATLNVEAEPSGKLRSAKAEAEPGVELPSGLAACLERSARVSYFPETDAGAKVTLRVEFAKP